MTDSVAVEAHRLFGTAMAWTRQDLDLYLNRSRVLAGSIVLGVVDLLPEDEGGDLLACPADHVSHAFVRRAWEVLLSIVDEEEWSRYDDEDGAGGRRQRWYSMIWSARSESNQTPWFTCLARTDPLRPLDDVALLVVDGDGGRPGVVVRFLALEPWPREAVAEEVDLVERFFARIRSETGACPPR